MNQPYTIAVLCGGPSTEHAISILSAEHITEGLLSLGHQVIVVYIGQSGAWQQVNNPEAFFLAFKDTHTAKHQHTQSISLTFGKPTPLHLTNNGQPIHVDLFFPALHGTFGEDGVIQGVLEAIGKPYVGAGCLSSAFCMDKIITKQSLKSVGLPIVPWQAFDQSTLDKTSYDLCVNTLGCDLYIKPARLGSSIGVHRCNSRDAFYAAAHNALLYDHVILVEPTVLGREIECAVIGAKKPWASIPGEITVAGTQGYSFAEKYLDKNPDKTSIASALTESEQNSIKNLSIAAFKHLQCNGLARVDFFLSEDNGLFINEVNTMPGFTPISLFPKLMAASGLNFDGLLSKLIELAQIRHKADKRLARHFTPNLEMQNS